VTAWLRVVGIGEDGMGGLGGRRHLGFVAEDGRPRLAWRSPIADSLEELEAWTGRRVTVLASGDPGWFGVARLLRQRFGAAAIEVIPQVAAFQLACARLGWPLEDTVCLSLHGRPLATLRRELQPGARLLLLTSDGAAPAAISRLLRADGLDDASLWVLARLGGPAEVITAVTAATLDPDRCAELNIVAIELPADAPAIARTAGLSDELFDHDGQLTKAEIRAMTLSALAPRDGELLWDVGAGAGSVAIEWLRSGRRLRAIAIEREPTRVERIRANAERLGVPELEVIAGTAPGALAGLPRPDAVFVGGGAGEDGVLDAAWRALAAGGRLVANAVTIRAEAALLARHEAWGGAMTRVTVSRAAPVGGLLAWRPLMPVTQLRVVKSCDAAS
jgi:precorrin-6Y C5,15-methyltransferase (decarboxylating)